WSHQIRDILSKDSAQPLLDGLNPLPRAEFDFWYSRQVNLQCINEQLYAPSVQKIAEILERAKSCYWPALKNVFKDVSAALKNSEFFRENILSYSMWFFFHFCENFNPFLFTQVPPYINNVIYTVCLIWANSEYYNVPSRVIVILQEICNLLIEMVQFCIKNVFYCSNLPFPKSIFCFYLQDKEPQYWEFPSTLVFTRMNSFFHRLKTIEELYMTAIEFLKLEKIELGGVRGNILGSLVVQIYEEILEHVKVFAECKYDPLDPADEQFEEDYADFQIKVQDLDRRLATIFYQGFVDCSSFESAVKQIHMFASLLERPLIKADVSPHYATLLDMFNAELDNAKILFDAQISATKIGDGIPPISKNMPPIAGQLKWALELQERIEFPRKDVRAIDHP
uniref:Dynein heavy chain tail domain-containing protein n=1 Tax=Salvator merianae TaxID=96440 RepID=A0A8D0B8Z9_SALMN